MSDHGNPAAATQTPLADAAEQAIGRPRESAEPSLWLSALTLWQRELQGFYRQRGRVIGSLATPLVFWLLLSSGFSRSLQTGGGSAAFFFPGMVALVVLFTAIFSNISVIEDRREGFLLSVLVAPVPRLALVLGKVLGATSIGLLQGIVFLPLAPLAGAPLALSQTPALLGVLALTAFGLTCLGFFFAWWLNSVQGFHSVMNVVLMPMWVLSGALFPAEGAAAWIRWVIQVNPLHYGVAAMRRTLDPAAAAGEPPLEVCLAVLAVFSAAALAASVYQVSRPTEGNLG